METISLSSTDSILGTRIQDVIGGFVACFVGASVAAVSVIRRMNRRHSMSEALLQEHAEA
jgi:hypothetical protein